MIPKILHQTWKSADLPAELSRYRETWRLRNRDLEMRFYDDDDCRELVARDFPQYLEIYDCMPFAIQRADFFRYLAVYRFGGVYADLDVESLRPFDKFFALGGALFGIERHVTRSTQARHGYAEPYQIGNCIFAATPGHPFLLAIIERVAALAAAHPQASLGEVEDITGPRMLTRLFYEARPQDVNVVAQIYWLPWKLYPLIPPINRNMHTIHHCAGTWKQGEAFATNLRARWADIDLPPNPFPTGLFHKPGA